MEPLLQPGQTRVYSFPAGIKAPVLSLSFSLPPQRDTWPQEHKAFILLEYSVQVKLRDRVRGAQSGAGSSHLPAGRHNHLGTAHGAPSGRLFTGSR